MSLAETAVSGADLSIPLIDIAQFTHASSPESRRRCAASVLHGFTTSGFIYLKNHGIPVSSVQNAFMNSAKFFERPQEQKDALAWSSPSSNRGYMRLGREKTTDLTDKEKAATLRGGLPDMKETIDIGREAVEGLPNQWPDSFDDDGKAFKQDIYQFWLRCKELHVQVMRCIALGMGYNIDYFDTYTEKGDNTLRLLHYPSVPKSAFDHAERAGAHCDFGTITLLFQDNTGGLQVRSPSGVFVPATPIPDTIVVNAGDLLARWSNDLVKSTLHRVVQPNHVAANEDEMYPERYSIAYFCNPDFDKMIEALPGTWEESEIGKKYAPIKSGDYLIERLGITVASY